MIDHLADLRMSEDKTIDQPHVLEALGQFAAFRFDGSDTLPVGALPPDEDFTLLYRAACWRISQLKGASSVSEDSDITQINLPTDEQVERAARALCAADGKNPDTNFGFKDGEVWRLAEYTIPARQHLVILLNKDRILGYR